MKVLTSFFSFRYSSVSLLSQIICFVGNGNKDTSRIVHGIGVFKKTYGWQEDTPQIDHCRIEKFSGDAIHFERIWCFFV